MTIIYPEELMAQRIKELEEALHGLKAVADEFGLTLLYQADPRMIAAHKALGDKTND